MIPRTIPSWQPKNWQEEISDLVTDVEELVELLAIDRACLPAAKRAAALFPLRATRAYVSRIKPGNIDDPLLRQILPIDDEHKNPDGFNTDPLAEIAFNTRPGIIHKYHGRALLISSTHCAINCRYCFRRHFDYQSNALSRDQWQESLDYIRRREDIEEAILSGGDPLAVTDKQLDWLVSRLEAIPHLKRLRIHSRLPIVAPSRLYTPLLQRLQESPLQTVMVVHCNHPQEIDVKVGSSLQRLRDHGITALNQSVLLRQVNDEPQVLAQLSEKLFLNGVLPYYLHQLDKVQGASHFYVEESRAHSINNALLATLPGYLVPKMVKEVPNAPSKVPLT